MKKILIADASKAGLVMTSEVFKDNFPGVQVVVAKTSDDALALAKTSQPLDGCIIDFDLPGRNGALTAKRLKRLAATPILLTAFDLPEVRRTIEKELAPYDDCLNWLKKPVNAEVVVRVARRFITGKYRTQRRVPCAVPGFIEAQTDRSSGTTARVLLPILIEDCSIGGCKFRFSSELIQSSAKLRKLLQEFSPAAGDPVIVHTPGTQDLLQLGFDPLTWQQESLGRRGKPLTGAPELQAIRLKVAWQQAASPGVYGLQTENQVLSRKLFEAALQQQVAAGGGEPSSG